MDQQVNLGGSSYSITFDPASRITGIAEAANPPNTNTYGYDVLDRLSSLTPASGALRKFVFDPTGSTTDDGLNTYGYETSGRMNEATSAIGVTDYYVNALGQRIRKTNSLEDTVYQYDTSGRLISESSAAGVLKREYIYLGDIPIGVLVVP